MGWVSHREDDEARSADAQALEGGTSPDILASRARPSSIRRIADTGRLATVEEVRAAVRKQRDDAKQALAVRRAKQLAKSPQARRIAELEAEIVNLKKIMANQANELRKLRGMNAR